MKYKDNVFEGYLDDNQEYYDYGTSTISGNNIIDTNTTGVSFYNQFLNSKNAQYMAEHKNLKGEIILMSPEEYYKECAKTCWGGRSNVEKLKSERARDVKTLEKLKNVLQIYKRKLCLPMINYAEGEQEGLHRMYVIGELYGWDFKVPVLKVTYVDEERARRAKEEKRKSDIDWRVERAIQQSQRYEFRDKEELEDQLGYDLSREFQYVSDVILPDKITLKETQDGYILNVDRYEYPIDKNEIKWATNTETDDNIDDLLDIEDLESDEDFLIRYFGNDWREKYPHLKNTFNIKESIISNNSLIYQCAQKARIYITNKYGTGTNLCGRCIEAADYLVDCLKLNDINAKTVEGYIIYDIDENCSDRAWDEHTWVELDDGTVVDVTVEQFNYQMYEDYPPILIEKEPHGYVYEKPSFTWLDELDENYSQQKISEINLEDVRKALDECNNSYYMNTSMVMEVCCEKLYYNYNIDARYKGRTIYIGDDKLAIVQVSKDGPNMVGMIGYKLFLRGDN